MLSNPALEDVAVDILFLDNTYCAPHFVFPDPKLVIDQTVKIIRYVKGLARARGGGAAHVFRIRMPGMLLLSVALRALGFFIVLLPSTGRRLLGAWCWLVPYVPAECRNHPDHNVVIAVDTLGKEHFLHDVAVVRTV